MSSTASDASASAASKQGGERDVGLLSPGHYRAAVAKAPLLRARNR